MRVTGMPKSPLQTQFPLSETRKFWKKFGGSAILGTIMLVIIISVGAAIAATTEDAGTSMVTWIGVIVIGGLVFLNMGINFWYQWAYIQRYYYSADADFLTIKKGVIMPAEIHVQYRKIQDVYVDQDLTDRIFGIYDVHVASATATSAMEAHIDGVEKEAAEGLKNYLLNAMRNSQMGLTPDGSSQPGGAPVAAAPGRSAPDQATLSALHNVNRMTYPLTKEWYCGEIISTLIGIAVSIPLWYFAVIWVSSEDKGSGSLITPEFQSYIMLAYLAFMALYIFTRFVKLGLWVSHYRYAFEPDYISMKTGIIALSEKHIPYTSVQNITVQQGLIDRILGIADVSIENAASVQIGTSKSGPIMGADTIQIEGLFLSEAQMLTDLLRKALFAAPQTTTGV